MASSKNPQTAGSSFIGEKMEKLVIIGCGGHAFSVFDSVTDYEVVGFVDENINGSYLGLPIYEKVRDVPDYKNVRFHVGIGDCYAREKFYRICKEAGVRLATVIHPSAIVSRFAKIQDGNFIGRLAIINVDVEIGENNIINTHAIVEHGCRIGKNCNISTNTTLNGDEVIGNGCFIGSNAVLKGQISIGEHSVIGCGAVCIKDVDPYTVVAGCPAKKIKDVDYNEEQNFGDSAAS